MPTIIKVQEIGEATPMYVNADHFLEFYSRSDTKHTVIEYINGTTIVVKGHHDEIAALIREAMNPFGSDYKLPQWARERETDLPEGYTTGVQTGNWPGLTELHGESTSDGHEDPNTVPLPNLKPVVMPEDNMAPVPDYKWPEWERNLGSGIVPGTPKE